MIQKKWLFPTLVALALSPFVISKGSSYNIVPGSLPQAQLQQHLLISEQDGLLPAQQAFDTYGKLDFLIASMYSVRRGEWLEKIARYLNVSALSLRSTNNLDDPLLRPRQEILIQNKGGMVHLAKNGESLNSVIQDYTKLGGKKEEILANNSLSDLTYLKNGEFYLLPGSKLYIPDARRSFPFLFRPVNWTRLSSNFGARRHPILKTWRRHDGYDMAAPYGTPVYAGQNGVVTYAGWKGGYGNLVEIRHSQITTRYGHLSKVNVSVGQKVRRKQLIGRVGSTGLSTGPHLHFEVRKNSTGQAVRPGRYLF